MEERLKVKLKSFLKMVFELVNNLPQEEERKRIIFDLVDKLAPMNIIHQIGSAQAFDLAEFQSKDGIIVDHVALQFKLDESLMHASKVIDRISYSEGKLLLSRIREVVWDFHNLVKTMIQPFFEEEDQEVP